MSENVKPKSSSSNSASKNRAHKRPLLDTNSKPTNLWASSFACQSTKNATVAHFQVSLSALSPANRLMNQHPNVKSAKDIVILHESKKLKSFIESSANKREKLHENKRDPILQNNNEPLHKFKLSKQAVPTAVRNSKSKDENAKRAKKQGDFNERYNPRLEEQKPQGIRAFLVLPPESTVENQKRQLKSVRSKTAERFRNPLTEGDGESIVFKRELKKVESSEDLQKQNDKKYLLPAERGRSGQGRLFRDASANLLAIDDVPRSVERQSAERQRSSSAKEKKVRGSMKEVIQYENGPSFQDNGFPEKCNTIKFSDLIKAQTPAKDRIFARQKTLDY